MKRNGGQLASILLYEGAMDDSTPKAPRIAVFPAPERGRLP